MRIMFCFIRLVFNSSLFEHASYRANSTRGNRIARTFENDGNGAGVWSFQWNLAVELFDISGKQNIRTCILMVKGEIICTPLRKKPEEYEKYFWSSYK